MMNPTVARIVEMMFENTEMTEEVAALHDEVMNNCQERYADLIASGIPEDDAVAAVVESLRGMEDVIAPYRCKTRRPVKEPAPAGADAPVKEPESGERDMVYGVQDIYCIDLTLVSEDVRLEESDDGMYHVRWDADEDPQIDVSAANGMLRITRLPGEWNKKNTVRDFRIDVSGAKNARVTVNGQEVHFDETGRVVEDVLDGVGSMMENLGRSLGRMFGCIRNAVSGGDGVTICIPHDAMPHVKLLTTSGDITVEGVALADLTVTSTSGDVTLDLSGEAHLAKAEIRTVSGDVDATLYADSLTANTTSGDVEVNGRVAKLQAATVSGDIDVRADVVSMQFKTVSGDADMEFDSDELREVSGSTISGDIDIDLPMGMGVMGIRTQTRSGDVTTRYSTNGHGPTVTGSVSSMSGDITIR